MRVSTTWLDASSPWYHSAVEHNLPFWAVERFISYHHTFLEKMPRETVLTAVLFKFKEEGWYQFYYHYQWKVLNSGS